MSVKIRKVGFSNVLTVPKSIKVSEREYNVYSGRNGAIVYLPKRRNPFEDPEFVKHHRFEGDTTGFVTGDVSDEESNYLPQRQDLIWINFRPSVGQEIRGHHPAAGFKFFRIQWDDGVGDDNANHPYQQ